MKTSPRPARWIALLALLAAPPPLLADLKLIFDVTQETSRPARPPQNEASRSTQQFALTVFLGDTAFSRITERESFFTDFSRRRFYWVKKPDRSFTDTPLYTHVGFREAELANRLRMGRGLVAAGLAQQELFDPVLLENLFSLRAPGRSPLVPVMEASRVSFAHADKPLAAFQRSGFALTEVESAQFARFLRHSFPLHPDILAVLQPLRLVPQEFEISRYDAAVDRFHFTLLQAERVYSSPSLAAILEGSTERPPDSPELRTALALTPAGFAATCDSLHLAAIAAAKSQRYLDALLLFFERTLSTGAPLPKEFATYKKAIEADPDCRRYFASRRSATKEATELSAQTLLALEAKTTAGRPVLKILRANLLTSLGKHSEAQRLFLAALAEKPHILGAWRDLGFNYANNFRMDLAWAWWDAARRLHPTSNQWKPIEDLEQRLLREHPEFF